MASRSRPVEAVERGSVALAAQQGAARLAEAGGFIVTPMTRSCGNSRRPVLSRALGQGAAPAQERALHQLV
jgi:hypothetical protein